MTTAYSVSSTLRKSIKPTQDKKYLAFIRSQPCCISGSWRGVESSHFGPRGRSQKADDRQALPLSRNLHRQHHELGTARFVEIHKLDLEKLILDYNALYDSRVEKIRPISRVRLSPKDLMEDVG